jgi:hypothetical protein
MSRVREGGTVRTKVEIVNYGDGMFPDELVARPGDPLQVRQVWASGKIVVRHHGYKGDHGGFYLNPGDYVEAHCQCVRPKRDTPCWCRPVEVGRFCRFCECKVADCICSPWFADHQQEACRVCGHILSCHTHLTESKEAAET